MSNDNEPKYTLNADELAQLRGRMMARSAVFEETRKAAKEEKAEADAAAQAERLKIKNRHIQAEEEGPDESELLGKKEELKAQAEEAAALEEQSWVLRTRKMSPRMDDEARLAVMGSRLKHGQKTVMEHGTHHYEDFMQDAQGSVSLENRAALINALLADHADFIWGRLVRQLQGESMTNTALADCFNDTVGGVINAAMLRYEKQIGTCDTHGNKKGSPTPTEREKLNRFRTGLSEAMELVVDDFTYCLCEVSEQAHEVIASSTQNKGRIR